MMAQHSPAPQYDAAVYNTPQLQLVVLQIFAQLQHERDIVRSENQMYKFQLSRAEDRCRKEQMRRLTAEHQMSEQVGVFQAKAQASLEAAAEVQRLLKKAEQELATAAEQATKFKELSEKKDKMLSNVKNELKLLEKSVQIAIKDNKLSQELAEGRKTQLQLMLKQSREVEEKLLESTKNVNYFKSLAEERELQLRTSDGKIEATEKELRSAKEQIRELQAALVKASQSGASCEAKYQMSVEEAIHLKNSMKADKEVLIQTWVTGNATVERLQLALEVQRNTSREEEEKASLQMAEEKTRQNEKEANFLQQVQKLRQELEVERNRFSSLQVTLDQAINTGFTNISALANTWVENQAKCQQEKQEQVDKMEEEKRRCEERNSAITENILRGLQQLNDTANANRQTSEHIKQTLLTGLDSERRMRSSLESKLSTNIPAQIESLKDALQAHHRNITTNLHTYIIKPKENLKKLPYILRGNTLQEALLAAARSGNVTELEVLLDSGANIESYDDRYKETPLIWAAEYGKLEACRFLLERGASLKARASGWGNRTPLHAAAVNNRLDVIKLLVEMGADLTAKDNDGKTPAEVGNDATKAWFRNRSG